MLMLMLMLMLMMRKPVLTVQHPAKIDCFGQGGWDACSTPYHPHIWPRDGTTTTASGTMRSAFRHSQGFQFACVGQEVRHWPELGSLVDGTVLIIPGRS
ncbi:hypothetical protein PAPYR_1443 [Paratrimastix pyriformis]|uniref:Secreted protein n=1 Tax=Paratrimastix pyriformis TaxID=342808 RepID=A0ABQ8UUX2_9EUKA|nr:hypothetical protein PAPYR_1443 [Paratrimastix pyriformis]